MSRQRTLIASAALLSLIAGAAYAETQTNPPRDQTVPEQSGQGMMENGGMMGQGGGMMGQGGGMMGMMGMMTQANKQMDGCDSMMKRAAPNEQWHKPKQPENNG